MLSVVKISPLTFERIDIGFNAFSTTDSTEGHGKWGYSNASRLSWRRIAIAQPVLTWKWIRLVFLLEFIPCRSVLSVVKISLNNRTN